MIVQCILQHTLQFLMLLVTFAGNQSNSTLLPCTQLQAHVITVSLPLSKVAFITVEDLYIASVAATAGVIVENVKIISLQEFSSRALLSTWQLLSASLSVQVQTSVLMSSLSGLQSNNIEDQSILNRNFNKNGLPSGQLVLSLADAKSSASTPVPVSNGASAAADSPSGPASSSSLHLLNMIIGPIIFIIVVAAGFGGFFAFRHYKKGLEGNNLQVGYLTVIQQ